MKNVKRFLVLMLSAIVSVSVMAQTDDSIITKVNEMDRLQKYVSVNVCILEDWTNIAVALVENEEDSPLYQNPYYWKYVCEGFESFLDKAAKDLDIYKEIPPTTEEIKNLATNYEYAILPSGRKLLTMLLLKAKMGNYI